METGNSARLFEAFAARTHPGAGLPLDCSPISALYAHGSDSTKLHRDQWFPSLPSPGVGVQGQGHSPSSRAHLPQGPTCIYVPIFFNSPPPGLRTYRRTSGMRRQTLAQAHGNLKLLFLPGTFPSHRAEEVTLQLTVLEIYLSFLLQQ